MRIVSTKTLKSGFTRVVVDLVNGEQLTSFKPNEESILNVKNDRFYKLGYPIDDIVGSHIIADTGQVVWDSLEQKWLDVN